MQELPLRERRDSAYFSGDIPDEYEEVFRAALRLRIDAGDSILQKHFATASRNAQTISVNIQN